MGPVDHAEKDLKKISYSAAIDLHTVDGPAKSESPVENGGKHPMIYRLSTILLVVQDFATIHSMTGHLYYARPIFGIRWKRLLPLGYPNFMMVSYNYQRDGFQTMANVFRKK